MKILMILFLFFIGLESFIYMYGKKQEEKECDYILILGAGLYGDVISSALQRRLDQGIKYANKYPEIPIIVSGGQGKDELCSEASAMKKYLLSQGISEERILMEDKSVSTYTNFKYTKEMLGSSNYKMLVTTCDFHMYRSISLGKDAGFICYRWPAKSTKINCVKYYIREFFCILYYWITKK